MNICQTKYGMYDAKRCEDTEDQKNGLRQIEINAITEPAGIGSTQQGNQPAGKLVWLNCEEALKNFEFYERQGHEKLDKKWQDEKLWIIWKRQGHDKDCVRDPTGIGSVQLQGNQSDG